MNGIDQIQVKGSVLIEHFRNGKLIDKREDHNLIQTIGIEHLGDYLTATYTGSYNWIGIGIGASGDNIALAALESEILEDGTAGTTHHVCSSRTSTAGVCEFVALFNMTNVVTKAVTECGLFDAASVGNILARKTFAAINLIATDSIQITWTITIS